MKCSKEIVIIIINLFHISKESNHNDCYHDGVAIDYSVAEGRFGCFHCTHFILWHTWMTLSCQQHLRNHKTFDWHQESEFWLKIEARPCWASPIHFMNKNNYVDKWHIESLFISRNELLVKRVTRSDGIHKMKGCLVKQTSSSRHSWFSCCFALLDSRKHVHVTTFLIDILHLVSWDLQAWCCGHIIIDHTFLGLTSSRYPWLTLLKLRTLRLWQITHLMSLPLIIILTCTTGDSVNCIEDT